MSAEAKGKSRRQAPERELALAELGIEALPLERRRLEHRRPGQAVIAAASRAEDARGGESDLIVIAAPPGAGSAVLDGLKAVLDG